MDMDMMRDQWLINLLIFVSFPLNMMISIIIINNQQFAHP